MPVMLFKRLVLAGFAGASLILASAFAAFWAMPATAQAPTIEFNIPAQDLGAALVEFGQQSGQELLYSGDDVVGLTGNAVQGSMTRQAAMARLLQGTGLEFDTTPSGGMIIGDRATLDARRAEWESSAIGAADVTNTVGQRQPGIEEIIVTGQKREERIQDVPIAISAFSAEDLEAQKLEGGFDLLKAIPNVSFSKTNFTSYNFQIRGVGTQAVSATTDPGVAVAFNNSAIIQNRLFEQEYLDVERVEVLRGPQGTLYGRNATAGVINVISNKPELGVWDGMLDVEVGNFNTRRLRGHFNMPIGDTVALRGAYASTERDGYTFNTATDNSVDGRDLWTGRLSLRWQPMDRLRADLIYERFEEDDDRLRTGKQLCHRDDGPEFIGDANVGETASSFFFDTPQVRRSLFSQGCKPGSLYTDGAFDTPNGLSYNFVLGVVASGPLGGFGPVIGRDSEGDLRPPIEIRDPYGGKRQSRDLREIESVRDPHYRAEADLFELNVDFEVTDVLTFTSQTAYVEDETFSFQDYNRFNSQPVFVDTLQLEYGGFPTRADYSDLAPGGVFCDPQIGCSDTVAGFDIAQASAEQFNQEFRLQSSFAGPLNFSVGANYTEFESLVDYYVMFNLITLTAMIPPFNGINSSGAPPALQDPPLCYGTLSGGFSDPVPLVTPGSLCPFVDPNAVDPTENFGSGGNNEGEGHNYFRSKNPYELESWAAFGELYWNIQDDLKLTVGLRYTDDTKTFTPVPTQVLLAPGLFAGGVVPKGYPENPPVEQQWGEWTGRLVLDWQPVLDFTDETLVYGSFSRGYKAGGHNPPKPGFATAEETGEQLGFPPGQVDLFKELGLLPILGLTADEYEDTFDPEFVNAYEIGTKNTLFGGAVMLNATAFYYDYSDYQVSQIRDRTAVNENFDAEMWGLELETIFAPTPNWQFLANVGYLDTKIGEGETSIDIMNRTQGDPGYQLVKPWSQLPSNCVAPTPVVEEWLEGRKSRVLFNYVNLCGGLGGQLAAFLDDPDDPTLGGTYDPANYPEINGGAGLEADIGGNELPQSPNLTVTLGGQYSFDLTRDWRATARVDYYWQDESYHRVYNLEPYDRLKSWSNTNLSFWVKNPTTGITVEAYVKNVFDETPITGAFTNSDDTGLTTNVFLLDPRLIGVSVRKEF